jgi:single-strand DNA-binding protein
MASLNKVMLIGNVGRDPEMRYLASGTAQTQFSLAVNRNFRGQDGNWREETEWFNIVAWADLAERLSQNVTKGKQVYVEGRLQTRTWDDDAGVKHYRTEVIANSVLLLGARDRDAAGGGAGGARGGDEWGEPGAAPRRRGGGEAFQPAAGGDVDVDDLPFE